MTAAFVLFKTTIILKNNVFKAVNKSHRQTVVHLMDC